MFLRVFLLVLMVLLAIRAFARLYTGIAQGARSGRPGPRSPSAPPVKMMRDPVCGTFVVPGKALAITAGDTTHWFCSERCRDEFQRRS